MTTTYTTRKWVNRSLGWSLAFGLAVLVGCGGGSPSAGEGGANQKVGGSVTGVLGPGLILKLNGGSDLSVDTDRAFRFADAVPGGSAYAVTVHNHPFGQRCRIDAGASGRVSDASESAVAVSCVSSPPADVPASTLLRGTVEGLVGSGLVIRSGADTVSIAPGATEFSFPTPFPGFVSATLEFLQQPSDPAQACTPIGGRGFGLFTSVGVDPRRPLVHLRCTTISLPSPGPGLALDRRSVAFAGEHGGSVAPQSVFVRWSEADKVEFISVTSSDEAAFSAEQLTLSPTSAQVWIRPAAPAGLRPGTYTGTVTVSACTQPQGCGQVVPAPQVVNVSYEVRPNQPVAAISASARGVAFSEIPGAWRLLRSLTVSDSAASPVAWRASADAPWVTVTRGGTRGGELAIQADTASLADLAEGFHQATVTIEPDDPGAAQPETVRVGLYKSSAPRATRVTVPADVTGVFSIADPIRPMFYQGGGDSLVAYHAYTGQATGILRLPGHSFKTMTASDDGTWLYLLDDTAGLRIIVVNLDTFSVHKVYPLAQAGSTGFVETFLVHAVVDGRAALLLSNVRAFGSADLPTPGKPVFDAATGALIGHVHGMVDIFRAVGNGGSVLYADGTLPDGVFEKRGLLRIELRSNSQGNVYGLPAEAPVLAENEGVISFGGARLAVGGSGNRVAYVGNRDSPFRVQAWNGVAHQQETGFPSAGDQENHLHFDVDGRLLTGLEFIDFVFTTRFRLYGDTGTLLKTLDVPLEGRRTAPVVSSDGFTLMSGERLLDLRP